MFTVIIISKSSICTNRWYLVLLLLFGLIYCGLHFRGISLLAEGDVCKENTTIWRLQKVAIIHNSMKTFDPEV
jgi:hypothetical protein